MTKHVCRILIFLLAALPTVHAAPASTSNETLVRIVQELKVVRLLEEITQHHRPERLAIVNVRIVSPLDGSVRESQIVLVDQGRFTRIGDASTPIPKGARRVDGAGRFLVPGLADMHVHSLVSNSQKLLNLANGVTTTRDMVGFPFLLRERDATAQNRLLAPNSYVAGPIIASMPLDEYAVVVFDADEAKAKVREHKGAGYDFVKVHNVLTPECYRAVVSEAAKLGIDVVGHVPHSIRLTEAIASKQRTLEHFKGHYSDRTLEIATDDYVALAHESTEAGVWICPTFYTRRGGLARKDLESLIESSEEMRYVPQANKRRWVNEAGETPNRINETIFANSCKIFRDLLPTQTLFIAGTDSGGGYSGHVPGFALHHELAVMESLGMKPLDVLRAATINAAKAMRRENEFGTIEVGKRADCILVRDNPLLATASLRNPDAVMVRGVWLDRTDLDRMLARLADIYANDDRLIGPDPQTASHAAVRELERIQNARFPAFTAREDVVYALAGLLQESGRNRDAIRLLENHTRDFPESAQGFARLALMYEKAGDAPRASASARRAFANDPWVDRAWALAGTGLDPSGVYELDTAMPHNGKLTPIHVRLEIAKTGDTFTGKAILGDGREFPLKEIRAARDRFIATIDLPNNPTLLRLLLRVDALSGEWLADFGAGKITGRRKSGVNSR